MELSVLIRLTASAPPFFSGQSHARNIRDVGRELHDYRCIRGFFHPRGNHFRVLGHLAPQTNPFRARSLPCGHPESAPTHPRPRPQRDEPFRASSSRLDSTISEAIPGFWNSAFSLPRFLGNVIFRRASLISSIFVKPYHFHAVVIHGAVSRRRVYYGLANRFPNLACCPIPRQTRA